MNCSTTKLETYTVFLSSRPRSWCQWAYNNNEDGCFVAAGPELWNSLPAHLRQTDINLEQFKRLLKTFLFGCWDRGALWLAVKSRLLKFSYLLRDYTNSDWHWGL